MQQMMESTGVRLTNAVIIYDLSAFYISSLMFYICISSFSIVQRFEHFNVIAHYKLNIITIIININKSM